MREVSVHEATTELPALIDAVADGEEVTITRDGRPAARLVTPVRDADDPRHPDRVAARAAAFEGLRKLRAEIIAQGGGMSVEEIIACRDEGRR